MDIKDIQEQAYQRGLEEGRSQGLLEQELKHGMAAFCDVSCIRIISCEDSTVHYLDFPDGLRLISHEGKYVGWYVSGEEGGGKDATAAVLCKACVYRHNSCFAGDGNIYCGLKHTYSPLNGSCKDGVMRDGGNENE